MKDIVILGFNKSSIWTHDYLLFCRLKNFQVMNSFHLNTK